MSYTVRGASRWSSTVSMSSHGGAACTIQLCAGLQSVASPPVLCDPTLCPCWFGLLAVIRISVRGVDAKEQRGVLRSNAAVPLRAVLARVHCHTDGCVAMAVQMRTLEQGHVITAVTESGSTGAAGVTATTTGRRVVASLSAQCGMQRGQQARAVEAASTVSGCVRAREEPGSGRWQNSCRPQACHDTAGQHTTQHNTTRMRQR